MKWLTARTLKNSITLIVTWSVLSIWTSVEHANSVDKVLIRKDLNYIQNLSPELNAILALLEMEVAETKELENIFIPIIMMYEGQFPPFSFHERINTIGTKYALAYVNLYELKAILKYQSIKYISLGGKLHYKEIDFTKRLRPDIPVSDGTLDTNSILLGIIDKDIQFSLDMNKNIASQVIAYWDQKESFEEDVSYKDGTINTKSFSSSVHGSVVSSIVNKITPKSYLVLVDSTFDNIDVISAVDAIKNIARTVNLPVIINLSAAAGAGSHDGTTLFEQILSNYINDDFKIVVAAGNEGDNKRHIEFNNSNLTNNEIDLKIQLDKDNMKGNLEVAFDLWFDSNIPCEVSVNSPQSFVTSEDIPQKTGRVYKYDDMYISICNNISNTLNNNSNILIIIKGNTPDNKFLGEWKINLRFKAPSIFVCDGWLALESQNSGYCSNYTSKRKTISSLATASQIISVGAFSESGNSKVFCSQGPTRDGRLKPDIFVKHNYRTSYASAIISGILAETMIKQATRETNTNQLLKTVAGKSKTIFLNSEVRQWSVEP
jgi:hypothetical protein